MTYVFGTGELSSESASSESIKRMEPRLRSKVVQSHLMSGAMDPLIQPYVCVCVREREIKVFVYMLVRLFQNES